VMRSPERFKLNPVVRWPSRHRCYPPRQNSPWKSDRNQPRHDKCARNGRVWTPHKMQAVFEVRAWALDQVRSCVRPHDAATTRRGPVWRYADRDQFAYARSRRSVHNAGSPDPVSRPFALTCLRPASIFDVNPPVAA
jgi:hypothetical protein